VVNLGDTVGCYRVVAALASGGMGQLWAAEHTLLGRRVAIKLIKPELSDRSDMVDRFFDEARAAARIEDPGIAQVFDYGRHEGSAYIVMEHLSGEVLSARLARIGTLPVVVACRLAVHVAMTMAVAHGGGIVHRDLKPDNLFLVQDPAVTGGERLKILDFGIAKLVVDQGTESHTQTGALLGTPTYMSPEQCRNAGGVDHRTDVYALGCVLFHLLCGRPPFVGTSPGDLIAAHVADQPLPASSLVASIPPALDVIIARCLAKSAEDRFGSMTELARALAPFAEMSIDIPTIPPLLASGQLAAVAATVSAPVGGFSTTLGTGVGEARAVAARKRPFGAIAILGVLAIGVVIASIHVARPGTSETSPVPSVTPEQPSPTPAPPVVERPPRPVAVEAKPLVAPSPKAEVGVRRPKRKPIPPAPPVRDPYSWE
jgi:serine/threonine-protein kinase